MINNNLRKIRKSKGINSATKLAEMARKPVSTVTSHENGSRNISDKDLEIYCALLNVTKEEITNTKINITPEVNNREMQIIISAFCKVQKRTKFNISQESIEKVIERIRIEKNLNQYEIELLIEHVIARELLSTECS